jgi:signal transduction histidine kinase
MIGGASPQWRLLLIGDGRAGSRLLSEAAAGGAPLLIQQRDGLDAGLARLALGEVDLVLLDPGVSGHDVVDGLHTLRRHAPWAPVVVLVESADDELELAAIAAGAQDVLVMRGCDPGRLARTVRHAVHRQQVLLDLRAELRAAKESVRAFVADASHSLRTPLTSVLLFAEFLAESWTELSEQERRSEVDAITRNAQRMATLLRDLRV